jgi:hypothetical protein
MTRPTCLLLATMAVGAWLLPPTPRAAGEQKDAQKKSTLEVGFAEVDITPKVGGKKPVYMAGFGPNRKATKVHDPLMARAVVLRDGKRKVALVSVDLVGFFRANVLHVRKRLGGYHVLVSSTHNHEGPDSLGLWGPQPFKSGVDPDYMKAVEDGLVKAVTRADRDAVPAAAHIGTARDADLLHDGREPYVKHDELVAIEFRGADGKKPVGILVQWNCHPETLASKNTQLSADYVGYTVSHLRKKFGCPVAYFTGTVGGLMTSLGVPVKGDDGKLLADGTFEKTERYGRLVGELAEKALKKAKAVRLTPLEVRTREVFIPLDNKLYLMARKIGTLPRDAYLWNGDPYKAEPTDSTDTKERLALKTEVGLLRLGELEVAAIPGEIYPELVLSKVQDPADKGADFPEAPIEPGIYKQMKGPHRMLIGLANDEIGYIIPKRQWDEKPPFCYGRKKAQYGEGNSVSPEAAPILCKAFQELAAGKKP